MLEPQDIDTLASTPRNSVSDDCARCEQLAGPMGHCAQHTTVEGLPNLLTAGSLWRKIVWSVILLMALACCTTHLILLIIDFHNSGVASTMMLNENVVEFPDLTICGLKPISESFLAQSFERNWTDLLLHYTRRLDGWFNDESSLQRRNESITDYMERMKALYYKMFEIVRLDKTFLDSWLSMHYQSSIFSCRFKRLPCEPSNFSLIQDHHHFDCLTFSPSESNKMADHGSKFNSILLINLFTDSSIFESHYQKHAAYKASSKTYYDKGLSLTEYLTTNPEEFPLNQILANNEQPNGISAILHPRNTYPFNGYQSYIIASGTSATFRISTLEKHKLNYKGRERCSDKPPDEVVYRTVRSVVNGTSESRAFVRSPEDDLYTWAQAELFQEPDEDGAPRPTLPKEALDRIRCHDRWWSKLLNSAPNHVTMWKPCHSVSREVQLESLDWPSDEDLMPIAVSFIKMRQRNAQHRDEYAVPSWNSSLTARTTYLRDYSAVHSLSRDSESLTKLLKESMPKAAIALNTQKVKENVVRLVVRLESPYSIAYTESFTYQWFEILSEPSGTVKLAM
uniref:Amiloride-sensitive sodium channel n=1 Tax=Macrostomum lignano TaxID=282301 RepID=A0A1I8G224_9PLAT